MDPLTLIIINMQIEELMQIEVLATKKEAIAFLLNMYGLDRPDTIRAYTRSLVRRWRKGISRQHLVELRILYGVLGQLLGRVRDI